MYKYIIKDIKFFGYHGLYDEEVKNGQDFFITVLYRVKNKNNINMKIEDVLDYSLVVKYINKIFNSRRYILMENLSKDMYDYLKSKFEIDYLSIEIKKVNPTLKDEVKYISTIYNG
jgi:dihydroneopterin aldolase